MSIPPNVGGRLVPPTSGDPATTAALRTEVREFLADQRAAGHYTPRVDSWLSAWDEDFTRAWPTAAGSA